MNSRITELEIKRQIIQGTSPLRLRCKAIEQNLSLENLLKAALAMETTDEQTTTEIEKQQSHAVGYGRNKVSNDQSQPKTDSRSTKCVLCGGNYPHQGNFPPQGKQFLNCGKMGHFSKVCLSKPSNRSKSARSRKPSKGKHRARSVDIEDPGGGETSTLRGGDSDNSVEYIFNIGT